MKHELASLILWLISGTATLLMVPTPQVMTRLAPLYFICAVGTIVIVRVARRSAAAARGA